MEPQPAADNLIDLLDQLQDYTLPPPVPMRPETWAWAILAALLLAAFAVALWALLRHRRATAWRRAALAELHVLGPSLASGDPAALARLQILLRRVAIATSPRVAVAGLNGETWTAWLAQTGGDFGPLAPILADAPYRPAGSFDGHAALAAARRWILRQHA